MKKRFPSNTVGIWRPYALEILKLLHSDESEIGKGNVLAGMSHMIASDARMIESTHVSPKVSGLPFRKPCNACEIENIIAGEDSVVASYQTFMRLTKKLQATSWQVIGVTASLAAAQTR